MIETIIALIGGVLAGYIGAISASGGLISISVLVLLGLPANAAIATNRFSGLGLYAGALPKFQKAKKIDWRRVWLLIPLAVAGGLIGSNLLVAIDKELLSKVVAVLLLCMLPIVWFNKKIGSEKLTVSKNRERIGYLVYFLMMIYGGFFGGGVGIFLIYALIYFFGMTYTEAIATYFFPWFILTLTVLVVFVSHDLVVYKLGIPMAIGMYAGGSIGAKHALKNGDEWIRIILAVMIIATCIKLLFF